MYQDRAIFQKIFDLIANHKVVILIGPRHCGKTTLLQQVALNLNRNYLFLDGNNLQTGKEIDQESISQFNRLIEGKEFLFIDEAHRTDSFLSNLADLLKAKPAIKIIAAASAALKPLYEDRKQIKIQNKKTLILFPFAQIELKEGLESSKKQELLEERLIYGALPQVVFEQENTKKKKILQKINQNYLLKDLLELNAIRHEKKIRSLLEILSFEIGKEVSHNELGEKLDLSKNTVEKYLFLLEKHFVLFKLRGFSRLLKKEVTKTSRYYFYDTGIRNAVINNFNPLRLRGDREMLFENYLLIERLKKQHLTDYLPNNYFWRTYQQKEIDLVEESPGKLSGYKFDYNPLKKAKPPRDWKKTYPEADFRLITKDNYLDFIS